MMSTSVCQPVGFQSKMRDKHIRHSGVLKVKRVLFGPPDNDHSILFEDLHNDCIANSLKWNFDFEQEKTLDPNGVYIWVPASPKRLGKPMKRHFIDDDADDDNDAMDDDNHPFYFEPIHAEPVREKMKPTTVVTQRLITDFMLSKKNLSDFGKKVTSSDRPMVKIPRISEES